MSTSHFNKTTLSDGSASDASPPPSYRPGVAGERGLEGGGGGAGGGPASSRRSSTTGQYSDLQHNDMTIPKYSRGAFAAREVDYDEPQQKQLHLSRPRKPNVPDSSFEGLSPAIDAPPPPSSRCAFDARCRWPAARARLPPHVRAYARARESKRVSVCVSVRVSAVERAHAPPVQAGGCDGPG